MENCERKTTCAMLVMCRFRWVSVLCKTGVPTLYKNEVSKSLGGGKSNFPWNVSHECSGYSSLYLGDKIIASTTLILVFLLVFYTFLTSLSSCAFIQSNKNVIIWNCTVRCYENLVLISYRRVVVNSSQNLIPWSCLCNFSLVICSDLGVNGFSAQLKQAMRRSILQVHFEFSRNAVFISWTSLTRWGKIYVLPGLS